MDQILQPTSTKAMQSCTYAIRSLRICLLNFDVKLVSGLWSELRPIYVYETVPIMYQDALIQVICGQKS